MAKKVTGLIKLQIAAGKANPAPPVGPALGQRGVNIMAFCKEFNARTQKQAGSVLPTIITVYADKSFTFLTKSPPASDLLKKAAGVQKGAKQAGGAPTVAAAEKIVGSVTSAQVAEIAKTKMADLNAYDEAAACKIIEGSARSMGIEVK